MNHDQFLSLVSGKGASDLSASARANEWNLSTFWRECDRGDWMLSVANELGIPHGKLIVAGVACARLSKGASRVFKSQDDSRIILSVPRALDLAELAGRGELKNPDDISDVRENPKQAWPWSHVIAPAYYAICAAAKHNAAHVPFYACATANNAFHEGAKGTGDAVRHVIPLNAIAGRTAA